MAKLTKRMKAAQSKVEAQKLRLKRKSSTPLLTLWRW